ncbi:MAG: type VI secretion system contractile sheath large subunit [Planctomycetota bacterium]|jgi:type VI secretion system ImpC/EvpB family protein
MSAGSAENERQRVPSSEGDQPTSSPAAPQSPTAETAAPTLIDAVVEATTGQREEIRQKLDRFLEEPSQAEALRLWLAWSAPSGEAADGKLPREQVAERLSRDVAQLDALIARQVNAILHHRRFQKLEASWRGLEYLVGQVDETENIKVRVLNVSWKEITRDVERAIEFDQSQLFRKIYNEEFDMPGGEPFSVLIGDYEIRPRPSKDHPVDDIGVLSAISHVAAAAFAPFVAGAHPSMFELDQFSDLERPLDLNKTHQQLDYLKWRAFRETEDARFVGLTLPRVLFRKPYADDGSRTDGFLFRENVAGRDRSKYLWGNASYAFGAVLARAFAQSGWLADIRGMDRGIDGGGLVPGLPVHCFSTDREGVAPKSSTDVAVTDFLEQELSELGFISLCHCQDTEVSAFYTNHSVQKPKQYDELAATTNARMSAMLQYMLCVSRFSHYLKVLARDKVGSFTEPADCERYLYDWIQDYVTADAEASPETKAKFPLREAKVQVRQHPDKPGDYLCVAHLWPHFELDELTASVRVTTELAPGRFG